MITLKKIIRFFWFVSPGAILGVSIIRFDLSLWPACALFFTTSVLSYICGFIDGEKP